MDRKKAVETILEREIRVFDNGGVTLDRYTAFVPDGRRYAVIGLSDDPFSPLGFCQYCGDESAPFAPENEKGIPDMEVSPSELSDDVLSAILRYSEPDPGASDLPAKETTGEPSP